MTRLSLPFAAALFALAACSQQPADDLAALDNQIVGNDADPALTSALEDQITVDPALTQQSNSTAVRRTPRPVQAQVPPGDDAATAGLRSGACGGAFNYAAGWARRMPQAFAIYPGGRVIEAAGNAGGACRVVTFASAAPSEKIVDWYRASAVRAGYSAEQQARDGDRILAGTRGDDAYFLIVTPKSGGSEVALIANHGV